MGQRTRARSKLKSTITLRTQTPACYSVCHSSFRRSWRWMMRNKKVRSRKRKSIREDPRNYAQRTRQGFLFGRGGGVGGGGMVHQNSVKFQNEYICYLGKSFYCFLFKSRYVRWYLYLLLSIYLFLSLLLPNTIPQSRIAVRRKKGWSCTRVCMHPAAIYQTISPRNFPNNQTFGEHGEVPLFVPNLWWKIPTILLHTSFTPIWIHHLPPFTSLYSSLDPVCTHAHEHTFTHTHTPCFRLLSKRHSFLPHNT